MPRDSIFVLRTVFNKKALQYIIYDVKIQSLKEVWRYCLPTDNSALNNVL